MSTTKIIVLSIFTILGLSIFAATCNWLGSGAKVIQQEFSPEAILKKYEWFKNQSQYIQKAKSDIVNLKAESGIRDGYEEDNGKDHSKWSPIVQHVYLEDVNQNKQQRLALISNTNTIIADYNAQSAKFNWRSFATKDDLPPQNFESIK